MATRLKAPTVRVATQAAVSMERRNCEGRFWGGFNPVMFLDKLKPLHRKMQISVN
jgi:hypothetical protein